MTAIAARASRMLPAVQVDLEDLVMTEQQVIRGSLSSVAVR